jgi:chromosome segregation ATPase
MQILNATKVVKSILTPQNQLISIQPGQLSEPTIASSALIGAAIKLGTEKEIGIILTTSYEMEQARKVSASIPYLYTEVEEAKSKLLDPSIDYLGTINATRVNMEKDKIIEDKNQQIATLESEVKDLKEQLRINSGEALKSELEAKLAKLDAEYKSLMIESQRKDTRIKEYEDQINDLNSSLNKVRADLGNASQNIPVMQKQLDENDKTITSLRDEVAATKSSLYHAEEELGKTREALTESVNKIEEMKSTFNSICAQFGIKRAEDGTFVMEANGEVE